MGALVSFQLRRCIPLVMLALCVFSLVFCLRPLDRRPEQVTNALMDIMRDRVKQVEEACPYASSQQDGDVPPYVFTFWNSEDLPPIAHCAMQRLRVKLTEQGKAWRLVVLSPQVLDLAIPGSRQILAITMAAGRSLALFSDWLRLALLERHGGVWVDATTLVNDGSLIPTWRQRLIDKPNMQLFAIRNDSHTRHLDGVPVFENWLLIARRGGALITAWLAEVERALVVGPETYCTDADVSFRLRVRLPGGYWAAYYAQQVVLRRMHNANPKAVHRAVGSETSYQYGFSVQSVHGYGTGSMIRRLLDPATQASHAIIKLTNWDREALRGREEEELIRLYAPRL